MEINGFGWQRKGLPNKQLEMNIKRGKSRFDVSDGAPKTVQAAGRTDCPGDQVMSPHDR